MGPVSASLKCSVQIAMSFFFATLFKNSRLAQIMMVLVVLCSVIVALAIQSIFGVDAAPSAFFIGPPFAYYRGM